MFKKVLIANRGAIATRIIRTLRRLSVSAVAVYAEADVDSLHVSQADEAWSLGEGRARDTYLDQDKILSIAQQAGVDAIHPGYGFLSENPDFVLQCEARGMVFIGPSAEQMRAFGLKHTARRLAQQNAIPLLPGSDLLQDLQHAQDTANNINYPVMLKSTAGGGGIGMQVCRNDEELRRGFDSVRRLSENNFANNGVFIEKFIEHARHIEVQIFGDGRGKAVALGERDCSTQRRNQKVIEEAPAPGITPALRAALHATALRLMQAVHYRNAGTVEFVYDHTTHQFYFLEVNTRLQVEHGVTEQIYAVDLVEWMLRLACGDMTRLPTPPTPQGHAIQVRLYAEDPHKEFQPCAGLLSQVDFPQQPNLRVDHWIESGCEISPWFDPLLAKLIVNAHDREQALQQMTSALSNSHVYGIETNCDYLRAVLNSELFMQGRITTRYLDQFVYHPHSMDVINAGTMTTIQDYPGRSGYWDVGVPPSGPFDDYSFRLGNRLLENSADSAGLEITLNGPTLKFNCPAQIVLSGALLQATLDDATVPFWQIITVQAGQILKLGKVIHSGARSYVLFKHGIDCPAYLGSRATFTLGQFGGHAGRALRAGDVMHLHPLLMPVATAVIPPAVQPSITHHWTLRVIPGPQGAPEFFACQDIEDFFSHAWEVHYNSSRTGIRLLGPKPRWARSDGGEAGMHPSNIHDNAYAIGAVDFTGDMPVILGPDGPSLGGFVSPATVITADHWKLGQLKAGDTLRFEPVSINDAIALELVQLHQLRTLQQADGDYTTATRAVPILGTRTTNQQAIQVLYRAAGDKFLLVEYGPMVLDITLRFRVHALMLWLQQHTVAGMLELTPGIRSLQIHYDHLRLPLNKLLDLLERAEQSLAQIDHQELPSRKVYLPLSWDDTACQLAIDKYMQSIRGDAPWCPNNIEFIRRINGLGSIEAVKNIVFAADYLVMGLGDVYLGAPVATPLDPRHRLVTTKYNPARTWTAENSVGIGGSYLCIYGMEGPGGYQLIGRTLQMWNRYHRSQAFDKPWLLRVFDQIHFYPVTAPELQTIRKNFPKGRYTLNIEPTTFKLKDYQALLAEHQEDIACFTQQRQAAFAAELQRWVSSGQIHFESSQDFTLDTTTTQILPPHCTAIESPVAGSVWKLLVRQGDKVELGQPLLILESMKMEIEITSSQDGSVYATLQQEGSQVNAGQSLLILQEN
ncbi:MAG: urea carboxylase [Gammaproteobacteria bacterium]|nr:urea carboxylase [Gammaproteobacteria bacterium]